MSYFPICVDLSGKDVYLIGSGEQIRDKKQKLEPFGANLLQQDTFTEADAQKQPAMVIVGDEAAADAREISDLCSRYRIPVNVVDVPRWCSFYFPALIQNGDLTVAVSTGGKSPGFAAALREKLEGAIPKRSGEILDWLGNLRSAMKKAHFPKESRQIMKTLIRKSIAADRPLSAKETEEILNGKEEFAV